MVELQASEKLGFDARRVFTPQGGEIESADEIYHDDVLFVSDGP